MFLRQKAKLVIVLSLCLVLNQPVYAQTSSSNNYSIQEYQFGSGGEVNSCSAGQYCAQSSVGDLGVGRTASNNYDASAGFYTPNEVFLEFVVTDATVDLGTLSATSSSSGEARAGACDCSFYVRSYLSSEYVVITASQPPTSESGAVLDAKTTLGAPSTSATVEEFGINLVDNSSPNIGKNPFNDPDNTFADGSVATGYSTVNQFKYGVGDIIARSPATVGNQGTGKTDYTISYIAKRKNTTEAGLYKMDHVLVATATY